MDNGLFDSMGNMTDSADTLATLCEEIMDTKIIQVIQVELEPVEMSAFANFVRLINEPRWNETWNDQHVFLFRKEHSNRR